MRKKYYAMILSGTLALVLASSQNTFSDEDHQEVTYYFEDEAPAGGDSAGTDDASGGDAPDVPSDDGSAGADDTSAGTDDNSADSGDTSAGSVSDPDDVYDANNDAPDTSDDASSGDSSSGQDTSEKSDTEPQQTEAAPSYDWNSYIPVYNPDEHYEDYDAYEENPEEYDTESDLPEEEESDEYNASLYQFPEYMIEDFHPLEQLPELPTGCEITALTMVLNYYGFPAKKEVLAAEYLPKAELVTYTGEDGEKHGPDLYNFFGGDPFDSGTICGPGAIVSAANSYLDDLIHSYEFASEYAEGRRVLYEAEDYTGLSLGKLYSLIRSNTPVIVWITIDMEKRMRPEQKWLTEDGREISWSINDHGAVLIGYTPEFVYIADPLEGIVEYGRREFERVFRSRGKMCVALNIK